jgi:hypothetical protein
MVESFLGLWDYRSSIGIKTTDRPSSKAPGERWQSLSERESQLNREFRIVNVEGMEWKDDRIS